MTTSRSIRDEGIARMVLEVQEEWERLILQPAPVDVAQLEDRVRDLYGALCLPAPRMIRVVGSPVELGRVVLEWTSRSLFSRTALTRSDFALVDGLPPQAGSSWLDGRAATAAFIRLRGAMLTLEDSVLRHLRTCRGPDTWTLPVEPMGLAWRPDIAATRDLFRRLGTVSVRHAAALRLLHAGAWDAALFNECAVVCGPPLRVRVDSRLRLHAGTAPAVEWEDGTRAFFIEGIEVPAAVVEERDSFPASVILTCPNVEQRRVMLQQMGHDRFLLETAPTVVDEDRDGAGMPRKLLRVPGTGEAWMFVCVRCPTTGREYALRVPPGMRTCHEAVAWTFTVESRAYEPSKET